MVTGKEPSVLLEFSFGSPSYVPEGLVHEVSDVPKDIDEYIDSQASISRQRLNILHGTTMERTTV